jgi:hypothetical protein
VRDIAVLRAPTCQPERVTVLMAQAVPSATMIPCIAAFPAGWSFDTATVRSGQARFSLRSHRAGDQAVIVTLTGMCDTSPARVAVETDEPGTQRFDNEQVVTRAGSGPERVYRFPGGCVTYDYSLAGGDASALTAEADEALAFLSRDRLVAYVRSQGDQTLCGAGTSCRG